MNPALLALLGARVAASGAFEFLQGFRYSDGSGYAGETTTFTARSLGAEAPDRTIVACLFVRHQDAMLSGAPTVTIGGVSATIDSYHHAIRSTIAIARAVVPSGATGDIVATWPGATTATSAGVSLYRASGLAVGFSAAQTANNINGNVSATIVGVSGGVVVANIYSHVATDITFTGAAEDYNTWNDIYLSHATARSVTAGSHTITTSGCGTGTHMAAVAYSLS